MYVIDLELRQGLTTGGEEGSPRFGYEMAQQGYRCIAPRSRVEWQGACCIWRLQGDKGSMRQ